MSPDLRTSYVGLSLRTPIVASAGPHTGDLGSLAQLEEAGISAVVLPSLFEEQIMNDALRLDEDLHRGAESFGEAQSFFPELDDYGMGPDRYLDLVSEASDRLEIPVIASLNADSVGGWVRYATLLEEAGADALELNIYAIAADPSRTAADVEGDHIQLIAEVRSAVNLPLAVKLSPHFSSFANFARRVRDAGADGLVLFNRFYQPDLDLDTLSVTPALELSSAWELRLPLRWIGILRSQLDCSLAATSGITDAAGVAKALLVGADAAMMTSALLRSGPALVSTVERGLVEWMEQREYESVTQLRGSVSREGAEDPAAFERANYLSVLRSWRPPPADPDRGMDP